MIASKQVVVQDSVVNGNRSQNKDLRVSRYHAPLPLTKHNLFSLVSPESVASRATESWTPFKSPEVGPFSCSDDNVLQCDGLFADLLCKNEQKHPSIVHLPSLPHTMDGQNSAQFAASFAKTEFAELRNYPTTAQAQRSVDSRCQDGKNNAQTSVRGAALCDSFSELPAERRTLEFRRQIEESWRFVPSTSELSSNVQYNPLTKTLAHSNALPNFHDRPFFSVDNLNDFSKQVPTCLTRNNFVSCGPVKPPNDAAIVPIWSCPFPDAHSFFSVPQQNLDGTIDTSNSVALDTGRLPEDAVAAKKCYQILDNTRLHENSNDDPFLPFDITKQWRPGGAIDAPLKNVAYASGHTFTGRRHSLETFHFTPHELSVNTRWPLNGGTIYEGNDSADHFRTTPSAVGAFGSFSGRSLMKSNSLYAQQAANNQSAPVLEPARRLSISPADFFRQSSSTSNTYKGHPSWSQDKHTLWVETVGLRKGGNEKLVETHSFSAQQQQQSLESPFVRRTQSLPQPQYTMNNSIQTPASSPGVSAEGWLYDTLLLKYEETGGPKRFRVPSCTTTYSGEASDINSPCQSSFTTSVGLRTTSSMCSPPLRSSFSLTTARSPWEAAGKVFLAKNDDNNVEKMFDEMSFGSTAPLSSNVANSNPNCSLSSYALRRLESDGELVTPQAYDQQQMQEVKRDNLATELHSPLNDTGFQCNNNNFHSNVTKLPTAHQNITPLPPNVSSLESRGASQFDASVPNAVGSRKSPFFMGKRASTVDLPGSSELITLDDLDEAQRCTLHMAIVTLYKDQIRPFQCEIRHRLQELHCLPKVERNFLLIYDALNTQYIVERSATAATTAVYLRETPEWFQGWVDVLDVHNPYPLSVWLSFYAYIVESLRAFPGHPTAANNGCNAEPQGGRYGMSKHLKAHGPPIFRNYSLGQVCHIVQLAVRLGMLAYEGTRLVPAASCSSAIRKLYPCDVHRRQGTSGTATMNLEGSQRYTTDSVESGENKDNNGFLSASRWPVVVCLAEAQRNLELLLTADDFKPMLLSQLKFRFLYRFKKRFDPMLFGFARLSDFLIERCSHCCRLIREGGRQVVVDRIPGSRVTSLENSDACSTKQQSQSSWNTSVKTGNRSHNEVLQPQNEEKPAAVNSVWNGTSNADRTAKVLLGLISKHKRFHFCITYAFWQYCTDTEQMVNASNDSTSGKTPNISPATRSNYSCSGKASTAVTESNSFQNSITFGSSAKFTDFLFASVLRPASTETPVILDATPLALPGSACNTATDRSSALSLLERCDQSTAAVFPKMCSLRWFSRRPLIERQLGNGKPLDEEGCNMLQEIVSAILPPRLPFASLSAELSRGPRPSKLRRQITSHITQLNCEIFCNTRPHKNTP